MNPVKGKIAFMDNRGFRLSPLARLHRHAVSLVMASLYRMEITGAEHLAKAAPGSGLVLISNHISQIDGIAWGCALPEHVTMTINSVSSASGYAAWLVRNYRTVVIDTTTAQSLRKLMRAAAAGDVCIVFPEGRTTRTGTLHKVHPGAGIVADYAGCSVMPAWIDGPQLTPFSYLKGRVRQRLFPRIRITFLAPRPFVLPADQDAEKRRECAATLMEEMMELAGATARHRPLTVFGQFQDIVRRVVVLSAPAVFVPGRPSVSFRALLRRSLEIAENLRAILLEAGAEPSFVGWVGGPDFESVAALLALQALALPTLVLDDTMEAATVVEACRAVAVRTILAPPGRLRSDVLDHLSTAGISCRWTDPNGPQRWAKFRRLLPGRRLPGLAAVPDTACLGIVTGRGGDGSQVVVLSHDNVLANRAQAETRLGLVPGERVYSSGALATAEGLLGGLLLPLLSGCACILRKPGMAPQSLPSGLSSDCASVLFLDPPTANTYRAAADPLDTTYVRRVYVTGPLVEAERLAWLEKLAVRPVPVLTDARAACFIAAPRPSSPAVPGFGPLLPRLTAQATQGGMLRLAGPTVALGMASPTRPGHVEPFDENGLTIAASRLQDAS